MGIPSPRVTSLNLTAGTKAYVMDGYGGVWPFNSAPSGDNGTYWPGWQIAKKLAVKPDGTAAYLLDGYGGVHPIKLGTNVAPPAAVGTPSWNFDIARDLIITDWAKPAGYVLDGYGSVHPFGGAPALATTAYWNGFDIARKLALNSTGTGGYVMDGYGGLHPVGSEPAAAGGPYWNGQDIAKQVLLNPGNTGGYVLDGSGGVHPFSVGSGTAPATPSGLAYWSGNTGVATDLAITSWTTPAGYTLDYKGGVHPFGGAPGLTGGPYWP